MSAGGVFKLIANDGKADRMIMATELLNQRIKDIMCMRATANPQADPTPTLVDIERTHILFVNAHFKPFAAIGYEYNKVKTQSGQAQYNGTVQYSIPQFGDFFNDMVVNTQLASTSASAWAAGDIPAFPARVGSADVGTYATTGQSETENATTNVYRRYTYSYVNANGDTVNRATATGSNFVRYCEYPGQRLFKNVKFEVNGNPLDEYTSEAVMFHQKFKIAPGKLTGWKRLVGQEVPVEAYSDLCSISGSSVFSAEHANLTQNVGGAAANVAPVNASVTSRKLDHVVHGPQTPKATQPALDMWTPLLFWFNKDARLSIASVSIPYGQRFITIDIEQQEKILFVAPGNLFLKLTTEVFDNADGLDDGAAIVSYKRYETLEPVVVPTSTIDTNQSVSTIDLYINNIFVNPEIHDIYIKRIGFSLIRVYRFQRSNHTTDSDEQLMSQLKWPIETIFAGMRPKFNTKAAVRSGLSVTSGNVNEWRDWHRLTRNVDRVNYSVSRSAGLMPTGNADPSALTPANITAAANTQEVVSQSSRLVFPEVTKTLTTIKIQAHGINIYQDLKAEFFSNYQPYIYGGYNIVTPEDEGAVMINFCLYPGTYQPSGHLNISRAREFFFVFTSAFTGSTDSNDPSSPAAAEGELLILAIAINFLLILTSGIKQWTACKSVNSSYRENSVKLTSNKMNILKSRYNPLVLKKDSSFLSARLLNCGNFLRAFEYCSTQATVCAHCA